MHDLTGSANSATSPRAEPQSTVWVSIPLNPRLLNYFLRFDDPTEAIVDVLMDHWSVHLDGEQETVSHPTDGDNRDTEPKYDEPPSNGSPWDEIRCVFSIAEKSVEGRGSMKKAAEIAYKHFGMALLKAPNGSLDDDIRKKLKTLMWASLPGSHSNKSVPWKRFQNHIQHLGERERQSAHSTPLEPKE